jgi:hypothetical protein
MLSKAEYHHQIHELVPCLEHGNKMVDLLRKLHHYLITEHCDKDSLYFISKREVILKESLKDCYNPNLNDHQLRIFNEVQSEVLAFLETQNASL